LLSHFYDNAECLSMLSHFYCYAVSFSLEPSCRTTLCWVSWRHRLFPAKLELGAKKIYPPFPGMEAGRRIKWDWRLWNLFRNNLWLRWSTCGQSCKIIYKCNLQQEWFFVTNFFFRKIVFTDHSYEELLSWIFFHRILTIFFLLFRNLREEICSQ